MTSSGQPSKGDFGSALTFHTPQELQHFGVELAGHLRAGDVIILVGGLGAGKTTFTQGLGAGLNVGGQVSSPTFIISRIHRSKGSGPDLVHVDAYRLTEFLDLETLDLESELDDAVLVVEWGKGLVEELFPEHLEIHIERPTGFVASDLDSFLQDPNGGARRVALSGFGERWRELVASLGFGEK